MTLRPRHIHLYLAALAVALATGAVDEATSTPRPAQALASPVVPAVDTYDRNAVNALYQSFYTAPPPDDWTGGSMAGCQPGRVSTDYQLAFAQTERYLASRSATATVTVTPAPAS